MSIDVAEYLRQHAGICAALGSPFYATLFEHAADDAARGGPIAAVFAGYPHEPVTSAMGLRLFGAVHRFVLDGEASALAARYPSTGGDGDATRAWPNFRALVAERVDLLRTLVAERGVQTNEVGRSAALACGFLTVARATGRPLRCLEVGASAGLNLRWDHFRYVAADAAWGDPASPVVLRDHWRAGPLPFDVAARVVERAGCDANPIDPTTPAGRATLVSFVWPDQTERRTLLAAACDVASRVPARVERADGAAWIAELLARPAPGVATVVYHSIVIQYFEPASRDRLIDALAEAGARATPDAPIAWLRLEPGGAQAEVRLTLWPGGEERLVATCGFHGRDVEMAHA